MVDGSPPATKAPPAALFRVINPVMGALLRSPLHRAVSGRLMRLEFTGRRSGTRYALPVGYVRFGDELLTGTEKGWKANFRGGLPVTVWLEGRRRQGSADLIEDAAGLEEAYRRIAAVQPGFFRFVGVRLGPDGLPDPADVARAAAAGHAVVRVRLDPATGVAPPMKGRHPPSAGPSGRRPARRSLTRGARGR